MARSVAEIHLGMLNAISSNEVLSAKLNSTSKVAIYRLFTFIVAGSIWILESFFDQHKAETDNKILNQKAGRKTWYRTKALSFQYGFELATDQDYFVNGSATEEEIEASKIVKYSAVDEAQSRVIIKIAGESNGVLAPITTEQKEALEEYFKEIKWAGTTITIINYLPDRFYFSIQIKRNSLVLSDTGMSIRNGNYPVIEAIQQFLKELPFDGDLRLSALVGRLKEIDGVLDATFLNAQSSWINSEINDYGSPQPIFISKIAESGYFEPVTFDNITYVE